MTARSIIAASIWLLLLLATIGCAPQPEGGLWIDPGTVRFTPQHTRATVAIHNVGLLGRPLHDIRLAGDDWDALRIVDEALPRTINGHDVVLLTLEVSPKAFASGPDQWREGHATLEFESEREHHEVALVFSPEAQPRGSIVLAVLLAVVLSLMAGAGALLRAPASSGRRSLGLGLAFTGLFAVAALLPLGPGWCSGRLGEAVGAVELAQCRAGLGGHGLVGWATDGSLAWLLVVLATATAGMAMSMPSRKRVVPLVARLLGFGLVIAAMVASFGASELELFSRPSGPDLAFDRHPTFELGRLSLPRLGVLAQPLAFVLVLLMIADAWPAKLEGAPGVLARLDDIVWSALVVALFFGAGFVPVPRLLHGAEIAIALATFAVETALIVLAVRRLRARRHHQPESAKYRTIATLALVNLLVTVTWMSWPS